MCPFFICAIILSSLLQQKAIVKPRVLNQFKGRTYFSRKQKNGAFEYKTKGEIHIKMHKISSVLDFYSLTFYISLFNDFSNRET